MTRSGRIATAAVIGGGESAAARLRAVGVEVVALIEAADVLEQRFDADTDTWTVRTRSADDVVVGAVVRAAGPGRFDPATVIGTDGRGLDEAWTPEPEAFLGVAVHRMPNLFLLGGPDAAVDDPTSPRVIDAQAGYAAALLAEAIARDCTRVEVKSHVQAQYHRETLRGVGRGRAYRRRLRRAVTSDYEFTSVDHREDDDDYRGPARLTFASGTVLDVRVHVLATYEPTENRIRWYGRVEPTAGLAEVHTRINLPVRLQITGHEPVDGTLVDVDPWGGSRIVGHGAHPYPTDLDDDLAALFAVASSDRQGPAWPT